MLWKIFFKVSDIVKTNRVKSNTPKKRPIWLIFIIKFVLEVNNCIFHRGNIGKELTIHFNFVNAIKLVSSICHLMEKFGVVVTIHKPVLLCPLTPVNTTQESSNFQSFILSTQERDCRCSSSSKDFTSSTKLAIFNSRWLKTSLFHSLSLVFKKFSFSAKMKLEGPVTFKSFQKELARSQKPSTSSHIFSNLNGRLLEKTSPPGEEWENGLK